MRTTVRWVVGLVVVLHGLIHLLGAAKGLGWAEVTQLAEPISAGLGAAWLVAAVITVAAGVLLLARVRWWWILGALAVASSQLVIVTSWADANVGTIVNVILLVAVVYGWASQGPLSARAEYRRRTTGALKNSRAVGLVTEADLQRLPALVADYIRQSGAVGQPFVQAFQAKFHGRIRSGPTKPWMTFTGEQVNTYGPQPSRLFFMDAALFGVPVEVLHVFEAGAATMRVRACSLFTMVNAKGPEMDRAETVTIFNDLCILAPAALIHAPTIWQSIDDNHVRGTYTYGEHTITAELTFNDNHELIDFVSDDRAAVSSDGKTLTPQRWSTPISAYQRVGHRRLGTNGEAHWNAPDGEFAYLQYNLDEMLEP
ncbi:DUF6544 family protein [Homoserinimonas sp. OAct 916]|uniref:DUF6544 family protein n=1 Tax=Homoserinimonas sp. OAct 916 TaxID=2211450 RepID=UPI000DBE8D67|nr:DUF6544 family protein [Homoserinimonas sp. OAct 916]